MDKKSIDKRKITVNIMMLAMFAALCYSSAQDEGDLVPYRYRSGGYVMPGFDDIMTITAGIGALLFLGLIVRDCVKRE